MEQEAEKKPNETYIELRTLRTTSRINKKNGEGLPGIKKRFSSQRSSVVVVVSGVLAVRMVSLLPSPLWWCCPCCCRRRRCSGGGGAPTAVIAVWWWWSLSLSYPHCPCHHGGGGRCCEYTDIFPFAPLLFIVSITFLISFRSDYLNHAI